MVTVIKVENLSKEDPYARKEEGSTGFGADRFWALKDFNFEIMNRLRSLTYCLSLFKEVRYGK